MTDAERRLRETLDKLERDNMWRPWMSEGALITAPFDCAAVCAVLDDLTALRRELAAVKAYRDEHVRCFLDRAERAESLAWRLLDLLDTTDAERQAPHWFDEKQVVLADPLAIRLRTEK